ncbi:DUF397 domain-containing protein [Streptomyces sp. NPDC001401]|uniref:DUF397 domain-containing protein n=1 Tax=Streptomyces sp. NPDC001401 TaxID=3364570 RepID=UPI00368DCC60
MNDSWPWRRSSASDMAGNQCVEVAWTGRSVLVRDSKDVINGSLSFTPASWQSFVEHWPDGAPGAARG